MTIHHMKISPQADVDPWAAAAALLGNDNGSGGDEWHHDRLNALITSPK